MIKSGIREDRMQTGFYWFGSTSNRVHRCSHENQNDLFILYGFNENQIVMEHKLSNIGVISDTKLTMGGSVCPLSTLGFNHSISPNISV